MKIKIKNLVTTEQYAQLKKEYAVLVKNKEITFYEFCTNTYKLKQERNVPLTYNNPCKNATKNG